METKNNFLVSYKIRLSFFGKTIKKRFYQNEFPQIVKYSKKPANKAVDWLKYFLMFYFLNCSANVG